MRETKKLTEDSLRRELSKFSARTMNDALLGEISRHMARVFGGGCSAQMNDGAIIVQVNGMRAALGRSSIRRAVV